MMNERRYLCLQHAHSSVRKMGATLYPSCCYLVNIHRAKERVLQFKRGLRAPKAKLGTVFHKTGLRSALGNQGDL